VDPGAEPGISTKRYFMEWHWFYVFGVLIPAIHTWALLSEQEPADPEIEKMWQDNF
jgi:hypothetical protein